MTSYHEYRKLLLPIARRIVGNTPDAEDLVQETLLRRLSMERSDLENERGYLVKSLINRSLNFLRDRKRAHARDEAAAEGTDSSPSHTRPVEDEAALSLGVLAMLEKLSPQERAVFMLKEVFGYAHAEIAELLGVSEEYCRQILARARRHLQDSRRRFEVNPQRQEALLRSFVRVCEGGDLGELLEILKEDIRIEVARPAAGIPAASIQGRLRAGEFLLSRHRLGFSYELMWLKDLPALVAYLFHQPVQIIQLDADDEAISRIAIRELEPAAALSRPA
ncbi:MAG: sigma-70 family RNA polymerase sigma factor, partial [Bacteroidetes bacterium]